MAVRFYYASGSPLRVAGVARARAQGHSLSSEDPVVRRRRSQDGGVCRAEPAPAGARSWSTTISCSPKSAAIVEYIEDRWPNGPALFAARTAQARDPAAYGARGGSTISPTSARVSRRRPSEETAKDLRQELAFWESAATGDYLTGELSAVDLTVFPLIALLASVRRPEGGFRQERFHRAASFGLDGSHARAADRPAHLAAALEMSRSGLTAAALAHDR